MLENGQLKGIFATVVTRCSLLVRSFVVRQTSRLVISFADVHKANRYGSFVLVQRQASSSPTRWEPELTRQSQDVDARETARTSSAGDADARRILDLDSRIQTLGRRIRQMRSRRRQASGSGSQNLAAEQLALR
jgi:hypothetical protein